GYACRAQCPKRLLKSFVPPIEQVVISKRAAGDVGRRQAADVPRAHAVEHRLVGPVVLALGDGGLKVDDPHIRPGGIHLWERVAPDVGEVYRSWDWAVSDLGQMNVLARVTDI